MYGKSVRDLHPAVSKTAAHVGPGAYDLPEKKKGEALAPFNSMARRETFLDQPDQTTAAPGPGSYYVDHKIAENRTLAGHASTMVSRTKRFTSSSTLAPGPGAYNPPMEVSARPFNQPLPKGAGAPTEGGPAKLQAGKHHPEKKLQYKHKPTAPSIPSGVHAYGYEEHDGELKPQPLPEKDTTMGPAYYNPSFDLPEQMERYRGNHFSLRTEQRITKIPKGKQNVPAPGHYNIAPPPPRPMSAPPAKLLVTRTIPRYHQLVEKEALKTGLPGPGAYDIRRDIGGRPPAIEPIVNVPFGAMANRFRQNRAHGPPVGSYNDPRTALQAVEKITSKSHNPFGQTTARFKQDRPYRLAPPATTYNLDHGLSIVDDCIRRSHVGRLGAFGSMTARKTTVVRKDQSEMPGPAHYQADLSRDFLSPQGGETMSTGMTEGSSDPRPSKKRTAAFRSNVQRLDDLQTKGKEAPPPTTYDVAASYEAMKGRQKAAPLTYTAATRHYSFISADKRFKEESTRLRKQARLPAPNDYGTEGHNAVGSNAKNVGMVTKTDRFSDPSTFTPGPGAYEFHPSVAHTVLKGTHNATLNNPLEAAEESTARRAVREKFVVGPL